MYKNWLVIATNRRTNDTIVYWDDSGADAIVDRQNFINRGYDRIEVYNVQVKQIFDEETHTFKTV